MNTTYEWLYDNYAEPLLKEIYGSEEKALEELSRELGLTDSGRVQLIDHLTTIGVCPGRAAWRAADRAHYEGDISKTEFCAKSSFDSFLSRKE